MTLRLIVFSVDVLILKDLEKNQNDLYIQGNDCENVLRVLLRSAWNKKRLSSLYVFPLLLRENGV
jgi:hypothetical protein